jgi:hypothetical protein
MHWKMSVDLSHHAVASMGNLDPYDGLVTYSLLKTLAERDGELYQTHLVYLAPCH